MPFQPVPQTAEVKCRYTNDLGSKEYLNTFYFHNPAGWTAVTILALANEVQLRFSTSLISQNVPDHAQLQQVSARDLSSEFGVSAVSPTENVPGSDANAFCNPQTAALIRFLPSAPPPRRGGVFWPFVPEAQVDEVGELALAYRNTLESRMQSWLEGVEAVTSSGHVIVSRYTRNPLPPPAQPRSILRPTGVTAQVTGYQTLRRVASQRDRREKLSGF